MINRYFPKSSAASGPNRSSPALKSFQPQINPLTFSVPDLLNFLCPLPSRNFGFCFSKQSSLYQSQSESLSGAFLSTNCSSYLPIWLAVLSSFNFTPSRIPTPPALSVHHRQNSALSVIPAAGHSASGHSEHFLFPLPLYGRRIFKQRPARELPGM